MGSGKTSFLKSFIDDYEGTIALLINDFGRINIDAMEFKEKSPSLVELTNGSIFCSCLKEDFIDNLAMLLEYEKDLILIEGSGLADPSNMQDVLNLLAEKTTHQFAYLGAICILDGQYFLKEVRAMESVVRQVSHSQLAILNKIDLIDDSIRNAVMVETLRLNPDILIVETAFGRYPASEILRLLRQQQRVDENQEILNTPENRPLTLIANFTDIKDDQELQDLLLKLIPHTNRMKGFVLIGQQLYKAESVQDTLEIRLADRRSSDADAFVLFLKNGMASLRAIQQLKLPKVHLKL